MIIEHVDVEYSYKELPQTDIDKLNSRINNLSSSVNTRIANIEEEKASEVRVDGIDEVIENILEDIIPSIIEDSADDTMDDFE